MPCGRGKKPHKATQKRKGKAIKINEKTLSYLDDHDQPKVPAPRPPDGGYIIYFLKDCVEMLRIKGNLKHEGQIPQPPGDLVVASRGRSLANLNMPCGRGKKPHKATQKRKGKAIKINEKTLSYLDDHDQPKVPAPRPPDGGYIIYFLKDCVEMLRIKGNLKHEGQIPQPPGDLVVTSRGRSEYFKDGTKLYGEINQIFFLCV
ncbi:unnamed protein product [Mytilus coruscus]|uniref:Uncharacterized protein n=1 Tax=Mytilus coruscus TaxID=42192 RepID=A0A6J8CKP3_MYTCO|nr:unnamed protein product [Mytilus coruscus]